MIREQNSLMFAARLISRDDVIIISILNSPANSKYLLANDFNVISATSPCINQLNLKISPKHRECWGR